MSEGTGHDERGGEEQFALPSLLAAAHELKTPLAVMRQLALVLEREDLSSDEIRQLAQRIGLTGERALRLTSDLTRGSRLQEQLFALEPLDVAPLCQDVIRELKPLYDARGQQLELRRPRTRLPLVVAHRDLLRRILINFADNALGHAEPSSAIELTASYRRSLEVVRLGIRDYGPSVRRGMFRSLNRPQQLSYRPQSSGLGLYISKQFADAIGAEIGVTGHRDGASFYVDVPLSHQLRLL